MAQRVSRLARHFSGLLALIVAVLLTVWVGGCQPVLTSSARSGAPTAQAASSTSAKASQVAQAAVWAPGALDDHYQKHPEGYGSMQEYDQGARDTIRRGTRFTYVDSQTDAPRVGYYEESTNRFTGMTADERRITTHFKPDRGVTYIRNLDQSTYR